MPALAPIRLGLIGSGWIGAFRAETIARRIHGVELAAVADPAPGAAARVAAPLGVAITYTDAAELFPDDSIDGVVISSPAFTHTNLVVAAAAAAGVPRQVGFSRRFGTDFAAAHRVVTTGGIGSVQLLRSLTRDPGLANPERVKPWTIFYETLIHDFDIPVRFTSTIARSLRPALAHVGFASSPLLVSPTRLSAWRSEANIPFGGGW
ncbi:Gfo/Idh/MocA family oxidoreductase [Microbacteriaceae bacterium VKM Ac-2855]|nr:Gfo/Idh/MocA family oxidoreductase [Microbacteriaceae bacterium VKM Ac-2855]